MIPSSKYNVDTTVDYGGGAVISLTKSIKNNLYTLNQDTDLSICYTNYNSDALTHIDQNLSPYNTDTDTSTSYGTITEASYSRTLKDWIRSAPAENIFAGFALYYDTDGTDRSNFWGYRGSASAVSGDANGRFLHDIDYNKLVFPMGNITVRDKSIYENIDYDTYPTSQYGSASAPSEHNITLSELDANPDNYLVSDFSFSNAFIYRPNNNDWVSTSIRPVLLINGETVGGVSAYKNPFLGFYYSNIGMTTNSPTDNPGGGGGGETPKVYNKLSTGYSIGFSNNFVIKQTKFATIQDAFTWGKAKYQEIYGTTSGTHNLYFEHQEIDLGDAVMCIQWYIEIKYVGWWVPPYVNCNVQLRMKGSFVNRYLAGTGLYWSIDGSMPTGLTPTTLHTSNKIWLGAMNADGSTSGTWVKGADIYTYTGYNKTGNTANPDYDPTKPAGGTDEDNDDPIPTVGAPYASGLSRYYVTTAASPILAHISEAFGAWNLKESGKDLYRNIISCKLIKSPAPIPVSGSEPFTVYGVTLQYEGSDITLPVVNDNPTASFGSYNIPRKFNDFRDYAPYTKVEIYLPYCGWTVLPSHVVGRSVSVTYYTDIIAATCKAVVYCGSNVVAEAAGVIGLDIPMVTENAGAKAEAVSMGLLAYGKAGLQTALGVGAAVATKGKAGVKSAVSGLENLVSAYSQTAMAFNQNYTEINGKNGDGCCIAGISAIVIKITRPKYGANTAAPYVPSEYGHATGFVSMKSATVGSFTGLLVADNVDTSGISGATDREKQLIKLYLESGIYVRHPN